MSRTATMDRLTCAASARTDGAVRQANAANARRPNRQVGLPKPQALESVRAPTELRNRPSFNLFRKPQLKTRSQR